jgi:hypothetical protein
MTNCAQGVLVGQQELAVGSQLDTRDVTVIANPQVVNPQ